MLTRTAVLLTSTAAQLFVLFIKIAFCGPIIRDSNIVRVVCGAASRGIITYRVRGVGVGGAGPNRFWRSSGSVDTDAPSIQTSMASTRVFYLQTLSLLCVWQPCHALLCLAVACLAMTCLALWASNVAGRGLLARLLAGVAKPVLQDLTGWLD
jgi:hypothetical protein